MVFRFSDSSILRSPGRRAFTLVELLVIVAIICAMMGVGVVSVRGGQAAARVKGATRDVFAAIRQARSQALVTQKPVVVTYSTEEADGEPVAKVEIASDGLFSTPLDKSKVQLLTGPSRRSSRKASSSSGEDGSLIQDVLFAPIREDVVRGMRLKVVVAEEEETERKPRVSVFSNVDYYLRQYGAKQAAATNAVDAGASSAAAKGGKGAAAVVERQEPVKVIWEANGRVDPPHRVFVYADGQRPEDGLSIRIDRFGAAKVLSGDGRDEEDDR